MPDEVAALRKKWDQDHAKLQNRNEEIKKKERKQETRIKIIVGALVIKRAKVDKGAGRFLAGILQLAQEREKDSDLVSLISEFPADVGKSDVGKSDSDTEAAKSDSDTEAAKSNTSKGGEA